MEERDDLTNVQQSPGPARVLQGSTNDKSSGLLCVTGEIALLMMLFFAYAGDAAPMVNEAHYLVKAKNFWQPDWCENDLFASSGKAHTTFYALFGWPTLLFSLDATAWIGRIVGWLMLAFGLQRLCWKLIPIPLTSVGVAAVWIVGIEFGNLAGEWVIGGIEAKVPAYGFVLLALAELVDRRWSRVWPLMGAASAFHVLSGGWSVIAAMLVWWVTERGKPDGARLVTPWLLLGGLISLLGLVPALMLTLGSSPEDATAAARIYAYYRIKHHLLPSDFLLAWYLRHGVLIAFTLCLTLLFSRAEDGWNRVKWFAVGAILIAVVGLVVGSLPPSLPDLAARLLRYYWFRLTDAIVPLLTGLIVMRLVVHGGKHRAFGVSLLAMSIVLMAGSIYRKSTLIVPPSTSNELLGWDVHATPAQQQQVYRDWRSVCRWAETATDDDEIFLTPRHQQTFKWYAQRAEVVNWKDVPQDAAKLREWYRRFRQVFPQRLGTIRVSIQYNALRELRDHYGVRFMIVDRRVTGANLPLVKVYPSETDRNDTYAVYLLPMD